jgi:DNA-binding SARP family transcriptional activator
MSDAESIVPVLSLRFFGPPKAWVQGVPLSPLRTRKDFWILALLAIHGGSPVDRAWLSGLLWPESTETGALANLRKSLKNLRRALGPAACCLRAPTARSLALDMSRVASDLSAFDAAIARADSFAANTGGAPPARSPAPLDRHAAHSASHIRSLEEAVALHRGPLLDGCIEAWVLPERSRREEAYLAALECLADEAAERGDWAGAERYLRRALFQSPLRESVVRSLMQVLVQGGSYAAALEVFRDLRLRLHRDLYAEPFPETTLLFRRLQRESQRRAQGGAPPGSVADGADTLRGNAWRNGPGRLAKGLATRLEQKTVAVLSNWERSEAFRLVVDPATNPCLASAIVRKTRFDLFSCRPHLSEATFTALGRLAKERPELTRRLILFSLSGGTEGERDLPDSLLPNRESLSGHSEPITPEALAIVAMGRLLAEREDPFSSLGYRCFFERLTDLLTARVDEVLKAAGPDVCPLRHGDVSEMRETAAARSLCDPLIDVAREFPEGIPAIEYGCDCLAAVYPLPLWRAALEQARGEFTRLTAAVVNQRPR